MNQEVNEQDGPIHVDRDAFFLALNRDPEIPYPKGRTCPQCGKTAWRDTRWCWHCRYDFGETVGIKALLTMTLVSNVACALLLLLR